MRGLAIGLLACGCGPSVDDTDDGYIVDFGPPVCVEVTPGTLGFDAVEIEIDLPRTEVVTVRNPCEGDLEITGLDLEAPDGSFTLGKLGSILIPHGQQTEFTITFEPQRPGLHADRVVIQSTADDDPVTFVDLSGDGVGPALEITPTFVDFGAPYIGCQLAAAVTLGNTGNADLVVDRMTMTPDSTELSLDLNAASTGLPPFTIPPTQEIEVYVDYRPLDTLEDDATVAIDSSSVWPPGARTLPVHGVGTVYGSTVDVFEQPDGTVVDVLFTLDRSGTSMIAADAALVAEIGTFLAEQGKDDTDYHVAAVVQDSGCILGSDVAIDSSFSAVEAEDAFTTMADLDFSASSAASNSERGYTLAESALVNTGAGDCNDGWYRDAAALSLIHVSNASEQSANSWSYYVALFQSLKDDPDQVRISAVTGDHPAGCGTAAAGTGYWEGTVATGGTFLSICATDFESHMRDLAASFTMDGFPLRARPVRQSLVVTVNGVVVTTGWRYDASTNAVVFVADHVPLPGSTIEVAYDILPPCET